MIHFSIGKELGKLQHLNMRTPKLSQKVIASVRQSDVVSDISELTPSVINEMEKLRRLEVIQRTLFVLSTRINCVVKE